MTDSSPRDRLPRERRLFYGGAFHDAREGRETALINPATGTSLGSAAEAGAADVDAAVAAASAAQPGWAATSPQARGDRLRALADALRRHGEELALLDAIDCGNPVAEMYRDVESGARGLELFAGLVTEIKGETIPVGDGFLDYTTREPLGVVARIIAYNHPIMFATMRCAAPMAAGNTVIVKPAEQSPLSAHRGVAKVALIGSVPTGKAILRAAADTVKPVGLEMGGKNALIAYPDQDPEAIAQGAVAGMNLTWAGQSCGSTSRVFLHASHHDAVLEKIVAGCAAYRPGDPTDPATTMGPLINRAQFDKTMRYIEYGKEDGARLVHGGGPSNAPGFEKGFFIDPTVFADVDMTMRIAREEIFGPVLSILRWEDEKDMFRQVNDTDYGLSAAIFTRDLATAHKAARRVEAGYVWVNHAGPHFIGAPFGGYKQSGLGREEGIGELLDSTRIKNINIKL